MISFLADENISPQSADHLEALGYPCRSLRRDGPRGLTDTEIVALAKIEGHVIITHDLDFGEIYYLAEKGRWASWFCVCGIKRSKRLTLSWSAFCSQPSWMKRFCAGPCGRL